MKTAPESAAPAHGNAGTDRRNGRRAQIPPGEMNRPMGRLDPIGRKLFGLPSFLIIIALWAVLFVPNTALRSLYHEEGRRAFLAKDVLEKGRWIQPTVLDRSYINKPPLQPWLMAVSAGITGHLDEWSVRLPALVMTLLGAFLVYGFTRMHTGKAGALCASAAFLLSPLVMEKARMGETDMTVTVMSLAAFYIWWRGFFTDRLSFRNWMACGLCLSAVSMAKGPVPVAFFGIAVFGVTVTRRRFGDLAGLACALVMPMLAVGAWGMAVYESGSAQAWVHQMRMDRETGSILDYAANQMVSTGNWLAAMLPWLLAGLPAMMPSCRRRLKIDGTLSLALLLYTAGFTVLLLFWPGIKSRYVMPVVPALAIASGMVCERLWHRKAFRRTCTTLFILLIAYQLTTNYVVLPLQKTYYTVRKQAGIDIGQALSGESGPFFAVNISHNVLFYTNLALQDIDVDRALAIDGPAFVILTDSGIKGFLNAWPGRHAIVAETKGKGKRRYFVVRLLPARSVEDADRYGFETTGETVFPRV